MTNVAIANAMRQINRPLTFGGWGAAGGIIAAIIRSLMVASQPTSPDSLILSIVDTTIAFGLIGGCVAIAVSAAGSRNIDLASRVKDAIKTGALPGIAAGCLGGILAEVLFRASEGSEALHVAVWGITGGLIGIALSFRSPNLVLWSGIVGGAVGGVIGGILSAWITVSLPIPEVMSRFAAFAAIGFFIPFGLFLLAPIFGSVAATTRAGPAVQAQTRPASGFSLRLSNGKTVSLADGVKLSAADIPGLQASAGNTVAEVGRNPNDPNVLGLKNLSRTAWTAMVANQNRVQIAPGRNVRIAAGTKISFGSVDAEIH